MACLKCHAIAGAGGQVGPGLESIGASAPVDYLLDSLLEPDKAVKENYHATVVATRDGRMLTGIKIRQGDAVVLRDAEDREVVIPLSEVDEQKIGGSLMPAGQTDVLTRGELLDLVRFLSELGRVGPYAVGQSILARTWRVLDPAPEVIEAVRALDDDALARDESRFRWSPAYSTVAGYLPRDVVPTLPGRRFGLCRAVIDVTSAGVVALSLNADGSRLWVDGALRTVSKGGTLELAAGPHSLTFAVPTDRLENAFQCELTLPPDSSARARFVLGK
jgi:putative heme-binding domain-containing protein